jgi:Glycosyl transferase family 90
MVPWKHYIPIDNDIHDMRNKWEYAQSNPEQIRHISEESSELAKFLLSDTYMEKVFQDLFVHYLGKLVRGFIPDGFWSIAKATYEENGYELLSIAKCEDLYCDISCEKDKNLIVSIFQFHYPPNNNTKQQ